MRLRRRGDARSRGGAGSGGGAGHWRGGRCADRGRGAPRARHGSPARRAPRCPSGRHRSPRERWLPEERWGPGGQLRWPPRVRQDRHRRRSIASCSPARGPREDCEPSENRGDESAHVGHYDYHRPICQREQAAQFRPPMLSFASACVPPIFLDTPAFLDTPSGHGSRLRRGAIRRFCREGRGGPGGAAGATTVGSGDRAARSQEAQEACSRKRGRGGRAEPSVEPRVEASTRGEPGIFVELRRLRHRGRLSGRGVCSAHARRLPRLRPSGERRHRLFESPPGECCKTSDCRGDGSSSQCVVGPVEPACMGGRRDPYERLHQRA